MEKHIEIRYDLVKQLLKDQEEGNLELLTPEIALTLKGKKIQVLAPGYRDQHSAFEFVVGDITNEFALAKHWEPVKDMSRQEYLRSIGAEKCMSERLVLLDVEGANTYLNKTPLENCFFCSDADRFVSFKVVE